jgi:hypothetical protein
MHCECNQISKARAKSVDSRDYGGKIGFVLWKNGRIEILIAKMMR